MERRKVSVSNDKHMYIDKAYRLFFVDGRTWSYIEEDFKKTYPEITEKDLKAIKNVLKYHLQQYMSQMEEKLPSPF